MKSATHDRSRRHVVQSEDGVSLAVREYGAVDAPVTAVRARPLPAHPLVGPTALAPERGVGSAVRMVFYDHPVHGESGSAPPHTYTIDQLGPATLDAVIRKSRPTGPIVLIGHSMGG